jgi:hypothetical protein
MPRPTSHGDGQSYSISNSHVEFVVDKESLRQVLLINSPSISCSTFVIILSVSILTALLNDKPKLKMEIEPYAIAFPAVLNIRWDRGADFTHN